MPLSEIRVLRKHVRQSRGMGQKVPDQNALPALTAELGNEALHGIGQGDFAPVCKDHETCDRHWLRDGSEEENRVRISRFTERSLHDRGTAADIEGGGGNLS
jgi:hypothetical protein